MINGPTLLFEYAVLGGIFAVINLAILMVNVKIYTEYFKDRSHNLMKKEAGK